MQSLIPALLGSLTGLVGTGLGGLLICLFRRPKPGLARLFIGCSAGMMLCIALVDMMPEALAIAGFLPAALGAAAGLAMVFLPALKPGENQAAPTSMLRLGMMVTIGVALHNFPEGLAIGSGLVGGELTQSYGFRLALLMLAHNIPEGMALALPLRLGEMGRTRIFFMALLSGLPEGIGAWLGYLLGGLSPVWIAASIAFGGGAMVGITIRGLLPESINGLYDGPGWLAVMMGILLGLVLIWAI